MTYKAMIHNSIEDSIMAKQAIDVDAVNNAVGRLISCYEHGHKVLLAGNGGSAADSQHMAAEFVGRYLMERKALPAMALPTNSSSITAIGNDYGYESVFSRQVEAFGQAKDILMVISTTGNSKNLVSAVEIAKKQGLVTIGLTGRDGGHIAKMVDCNINVAHQQTPRIQEAHILIIHILCDLVEKAIFSTK